MILNRRTMIKSTSAIALKLFGGCTHLPKSSEQIVVIGAGISGLAAAQSLQRAGYNITLLEARGRIGGRIWTESDFLGGPIDLGASWIHGDESNPLNELAKAQRIKTTVTDELSYPYTFSENGIRLSIDRQKIIYRIFKDDFKAAAYRHQARLNADSADRPLSQVFDEILGDLRLRGRIDESQEVELRHLIASDIEGSYATDAQNISLRHWDKGQWFKGSDLLLLDGYKQLLASLAKNLNVHLNKVVTKIRRDPQTIKVTTNDGSEYSAAKVIITLPLGVLKQGKILFQPELPEQKKAAISRLGVGVFNKVYLGFTSCFWPDDATWIQYMGKNSSHWPSFFSLKRYTGRSILVAYNVGSYAQALESLDDASVVRAAMNVLEQIAKQNSWPIKQPIASRITRWGRDPFACGSYSFVPVDSEMTDFDHVGSSVNNQLFFAGEATSSQHYMTAHAAYMSGLHAAEQVMKSER